MKKLLSVICALLLTVAPALSQIMPGVSGNPSPIARPGGTFYAAAFNWEAKVISGNSATGSSSIIIAGTSGGSGGLQLADGTTISLQTVFSTLTPIIVDWGQGAAETVTPTAVSVGTCPAGNIGIGGTVQCATVTASFTNTHGQSAVVRDGSYGLQTAINYANGLSAGSAAVVIDTAWTQMGGTSALITSAVPFASVSILDYRSSAPQVWSAQGGLTTLAAPATLTATTVGFALNGGNATGGTYTGTSTYNTCIAYVDIYGQEGPCSTAFSGLTAGTGATNQIGFSAPAASAGAVGYTIYISLASGGTTLQYKVPLATYAGGIMTTNNVCALTTLETTTAACKVTNSTYNQTGVAAVVSALTLNTSPIQPAVTVVSTTAIYVPNAGGRTTYAYTPGSHMGTPGIPLGFLPFTISAADATTVPSVLGTLNIPPNFMNFVGRTIEVCGYATTTASTATIENIQFQWDAIGQNTAGKGVPIADLTVTNTWATTGHLSFCAQFQTTVAGTGATAGSINSIAGFLGSAGVSLAAAAGGGNSLTGAQASLNLNSEARINVIYVHTTGTDGAALTLQSLTARVVN